MHKSTRRAPSLEASSFAFASLAFYSDHSPGIIRAGHPGLNVISRRGESRTGNRDAHSHSPPVPLLLSPVFAHAGKRKREATPLPCQEYLYTRDMRSSSAHHGEDLASERSGRGRCRGRKTVRDEEAWVVEALAHVNPKSHRAEADAKDLIRPLHETENRLAVCSS